MATVETIKKLKKNLETAAQENPVEALQILETLSKLEITVEILKGTRIGKSVGKLRKHTNSEIAKASSALVHTWKKAVQPTNETISKENDKEPQKREREQIKENEEEKIKKPKIKDEEKEKVGVTKKKRIPFIKR